MVSIIIPVILFALSMTITPGPNNMLLTASGARFGFVRTLPLIAGIVLGILSQLLLSALGMGFLFQRFPVLKTILTVLGSIYILYLAWKTAFPGKGKKGDEEIQKPFSMVQGFLFQYLNPKAYIMTITAMTVYPLTGESQWFSMLFIMASFLIICPLSISLWAGFGSLIKPLLKQGRGKWINYGLGGMTAASLIFLF